MAVTSPYEMHVLERDDLGDIDALLRRAHPDAKVALLNFETRSARAHFWPYVFAGSYALANGASLTSYSFSELSHWPTHYAPDRAPPNHRPFWAYAPCVYRYREDGDFFDDVLVQGAQNPFVDDAPGPRFRSIGTSGRFTLYEKVAEEPDASRAYPDRGPCPRRDPQMDIAP